MCNSYNKPEPQQSSNNYNTQIGFKNNIDQDQKNDYVAHLSQMKWYLFILLVLLVLVLVFVCVRYTNICINKRIERRAQANMIQMRRLQHEAGDWKANHSV